MGGGQEVGFAQVTYEEIRQRVRERADASPAPFLALLNGRHAACGEVDMCALSNLHQLKLYGMAWSRSRYDSLFDQFVLNNYPMEVTWDPEGDFRNLNFFGTRHDWNQTLVTRINEAKAMSCKRYKDVPRESGVEFSLFVKQEAMKIMQDLEYFKPYIPDFDLSVQCVQLSSFEVLFAGRLGDAIKVFMHTTQHAPEIVIVPTERTSNVRLTDLASYVKFV